MKPKTNQTTKLATMNAPVDPNKLLQQGLKLHQARQFPEAAQCYEQILRQNPRHFNALHLLATLNLQAQRFKIAVTLFDRAIALNPNYADAYSNRGNALMGLHRAADALINYDRAIAL